MKPSLDFDYHHANHYDRDAPVARETAKNIRQALREAIADAKKPRAYISFTQAAFVLVNDQTSCIAWSSPTFCELIKNKSPVGQSYVQFLPESALDRGSIKINKKLCRTHTGHLEIDDNQYTLLIIVPPE